MSNSKINFRPNTNTAEARDLLLEFYGLVAREIRELECYADRTFYVKVEPSGGDVKVDISGAYGEFVLKVHHSSDSDKEHVDAEHEALELLFKNGFSCPRTVKNVHGKLKSFITIEHPSDDGTTHSRRHVVRLLTYVPGQLLDDAPRSTRLFASVGKCLADFMSALKDLNHPGITNHESLWKMENIPKLKDYFQYIPDKSKVELVKKAMINFEAKVVPMCYKVERGTIHSDFNEKNILVSRVQDEDAQKDRYEITGIIDFGDLQSTCVIFDLTNAMTYMMLENKGTCSDPVEAGGHVLKGYLSRRKVSQEEMEMIPHCVTGRLLQSLVLGAYSYTLDPGNDYILSSSREGWNLLGHMMKLGPELVLQKWKNVAKLC